MRFMTLGFLGGEHSLVHWKFPSLVHWNCGVVRNEMINTHEYNAESLLLRMPGRRGSGSGNLCVQVVIVCQKSVVE